MQEIVANRKLKKKEFSLPDGSVLHRMHLGDIHYPDTNGDLQDVDYLFEDMGTYWKVEKCNYRVYIAKSFLANTPQGGDNLVLWRNRSGDASHGILFRPHSLRWVNNPDLSDMQLFKSAVDVQGVMTQNLDGGSGQVVWADAFGTNIDFVLRIARHGFQMVLVIRQKNALELPPTQDHKLTFLSRYDAEGALKLKARDAVADWDEDSYYESNEAFDLTEGGDNLKRTVFRPARIWDSEGGDKESQTIKTFWTKHNAVLWKVKVLPKAFLQNATYPVYTDASPAYATAGGDGTAYRGRNAEIWSTCRSGAGDGADTATTQDYIMLAQWKESSSETKCIRGFFPFDLSGESSGTVSVATLYIWASGFISSGSPTLAAIAVGDAAMASPATLVAGDYDNCTIDSMPEFCDSPPSASGWDTDAYKTITLNTAGKTFVENALGVGYADFITREGYYDADGNDVDLGANTIVAMEVILTEDTGSSDPYLEWTLAAAGLDIELAYHHYQRNLKQ